MKMLVFVYNKSLLQTLILKHQNHSLITSIIRCYTTKSIIPTNLDSSGEFKVSFLKDKCGLSGKPLIRACKCLHFDSSDQRPDSVLELFRSFGFTQPNITKILSNYPRILLAQNPQKLIKPKLDYLLTISQSQAEVVAIVTKNPCLLCKSLTNQLIPSLNLLNSVTGCCTNTVSVLKHNPYIIGYNFPKSFLLNTQFLLTLGVPHSQILKLLKGYGSALSIPHDKFCHVVLKLKDMHFDLSSSYFLHALFALAFIKDSIWESRCVLFRSFGFSDHDIFSMFKKLPQIMTYNDKTIIEKMDFFFNKLHWTPFRLSNCPIVLAVSLKNRTIPRCSVLQVLVLRNNTETSYNLWTILAMTERKFVEEFVSVHKDELPEVMEAYQGKLKFDEYTFKQKAQANLKTSCINQTPVISLN